MRRTLLLALVALFVVTFARTQAVTDGRLDGTAHPGVVLLLMEVGGQPAFRCTGTLLSATVLLTAGHCTNNFHDVGVAVLQAPGVILPPSQYGVLPSVNQLDTLKTRRGPQTVTFTAVGYGLQESFPDPAMFLATNSRTRYMATPRLLQINVPGFTGDFSLLLSNNHSTGGTCFGDSGGPNFFGSGATETKIVAGVTSFGLNGNCAGTGGVFRMDRQNVLDFVRSF